MKLQLIIEAENRDDIDGLKSILTNVQASMLTKAGSPTEPQKNPNKIIPMMEKVLEPILTPTEATEQELNPVPGMPETTGDTVQQEVSAPPNIPSTTDASAPAAEVTDAKGVVWNPEFHTSNKAVKTDNCFKAKPGVDKDAKAAYEAQFITAPIAPTPDEMATADPIGLPGATTAPVEPTLLDLLTAKLHAIAEAGIPCAHLDWTTESPTWKDKSPADAINAILRESGLSQGFIDLKDQDEEMIKVIELRIGLAWPNL